MATLLVVPGQSHEASELLMVLEELGNKVGNVEDGHISGG